MASVLRRFGYRAFSQGRLVRQQLKKEEEVPGEETEFKVVPKATSMPRAGELMQHFDLFSEQAHSEETRVDSYERDGFLVNNVRLQGPVFLLKNLSLLWDVGRVSDLNADSLLLLAVIKPLPEMLVLGTGRKAQTIPDEARNYLRSIGVMVEVMATPHACSTFNILVQEGRNVVAGLFPLVPTSARTGTTL